MKDTIKKSVAYVSTGSIVFSSLGAVIGQSVFAGQIDKKLDLSSLRNDVRSGSNSFVYAVFSDLKAYLVSQGKMSSNESLSTGVS